MNQNSYEGQMLDEAILVQRAVGHDTDAFGEPYGMHVSRVHGHIEIA
jgi:hypothetical protein